MLEPEDADDADAEGAVNSVALLLLKFSASVAFHVPDGSSMYAHAGTAVPAGSVSGKLPTAVNQYEALWRKVTHSSSHDCVQFVLHVTQLDKKVVVR